MIKIKTQDGQHQYDEEGRAITTWDHKKCAWIVEKEFENEKIDWYGKDSDFPSGCTLKQFEDRNPGWDKLPDIVVVWTWATKRDYEKMGGPPASFGKLSDYYDKLSYPQHCVRSWGYIDCAKEAAVARFANYAGFHKHASNVKVTYNGEVLFDGEYTE